MMTTSMLNKIIIKIPIPKKFPEIPFKIKPTISYGKYKNFGNGVKHQNLLVMTATPLIDNGEEGIKQAKGYR